MHRARKARGLSGGILSTPRATQQSRQSATGRPSDREGARDVRFDVERQKICQVMDKKSEPRRDEINRNDGDDASIGKAKHGGFPAQPTNQESPPGVVVEAEETAEENEEIGMVDKLLQEALRLNEVPGGDNEWTKEDTTRPVEFQGETFGSPISRHDTRRSIGVAMEL